jgi:hypothetical protein
MKLTRVPVTSLQVFSLALKFDQILMNRINVVSLSICSVLLATFAMAQSSNLLNVPKIYQGGISYQNETYYADDNETRDYKEFNDTKSVKNAEIWNVFAAKEGVPILDEPGGKVIKKAPFSQQFYVSENRGDYLKVQDLRSGDGINGWCHKDDLILWKYPLMDNETKIELKAFMVNNLLSKDVLKKIRENKEQYQIYNGPGKDAELVDTRMIYDVFFVYKYENPEKKFGGGRYLISQHYGLSSRTPLIGWVDEARVKIWRTSLCLEPNFDEKALAERNKKDVMATVFTRDFGGLDYAVAYKEKGTTGEGLVEGKLRDPALGDYKSEGRMYGNIFRYPVFQGDYSDGGQNTQFQTGVTGKSNIANSGVVEGFNDEVYTRLSKTRDRLNAEMNRENVVFVLDGSNGMKNYHNEITKVLRRLHDANAAENINTRRYGAVIYKNEFNTKSLRENPESDFCKVIAPSADAKEVAMHIEKYTIGEGGDPSEREAVNFALKKAMEMLVPNQTNIIIHLGNGPDNSEDTFWESVKDSTLVTYNDLGNLLRKDLDIHYINFTTYSTEVSQATRKVLYSETAQILLPEMATAQGNKYAGLSFVDEYKQPEIPVLAEQSLPEYDVSWMRKSPFSFKSYYLNDYHYPLTSTNILSEIDSCRLRTSEFLTSLNSVVEDESPLKERADDFSAPILDMIFKSLMKADEGDAEFYKDQKDWYAKSKVHIYVDAVTYYKTDVLEQPLFKYVLFMHEEQLKNKTRELGKLLSTLEDGTDTQKVLAGHWQRVAEETLGMGKSTGKISVDELKNRMLGVQDMDLILPPIYNKIGGKTIDEIEKGKGFSDQEMDELTRYFRKAFDEIEKIRNSDYYYRIPNTDQKFYWVPLEYIFG